MRRKEVYWGIEVPAEKETTLIIDAKVRNRGTSGLSGRKRGECISQQILSLLGGKEMACYQENRHGKEKKKEGQRQNRSERFGKKGPHLPHSPWKGGMEQYLVCDPNRSKESAAGRKRGTLAKETWRFLLGFSKDEVHYWKEW